MGLVRRLGRRFARGLASRLEGEAAPAPSTSPPRPAPDPPPSVDGRARLADLAALREAVLGPGRLRLVNHWATWCEGCVEELPLLVDLHARIGEDVEFLGVSWDGFQGSLSGDALVREVARFSRLQGLPWESLVVDAAPEALFEALDMTCHTVPQVWLVDAQGEIVHRVEAVLEPADVAELFERVSALAG